jgi:hypothetical protein
VFSSRDGLQGLPHVLPHCGLRQGGVQEGVEGGQLGRRQRGQGQPQGSGTSAFGVEGTATREGMQRIGVGTRLGHRDERRAAGGEGGPRAQCRLGQRELLGSRCEPVGTLWAARLLATALAMQRHRTMTGRIRTIAGLTMLHVELIIVEPAPQRHGFPRSVWGDVLPHASDADWGGHRPRAGFRFPGTGAKPFPTAHLPQPLGGQRLPPILQACMRLGARRAVVGA